MCYLVCRLGHGSFGLIGGAAVARILVIDDEEINRDLLRGMLESKGHLVVEASGGEAGLQVFRAHPADLVITDIMMPEKTGLEVIEELRRDFPAVPIMAVAAGGHDVLEQAAELGADQILEKPFRMKILLAAVERLLGEAG